MTRSEQGNSLTTRAWCFFVRNRGDFIGIGVIVLLIFAFLSPALHDGGSFGGFDLDVGKESSLGYGLFTAVHSANNGDAVSQMVSWNALDWQLIHHGSFPLWNEYSVLGMPQFLNFESSVLSLPDLVSYAFPVQFAFLVVVAMKFLIASTGVYVLCRALRMRAASSTFAAVTFMFAGAFASWITWPLSDVAAWSGWIAALALLAYRSRKGHRYVIPLALAVGFSIYGGFPEANVMMAMVFGVVVIVSGLALLIMRRRLSLFGIAHTVVGGIGGVAIAAPLWYAGQQVINVAHRQADTHYVGLPPKFFSLLATQGFYGLPTGANASFQVLHWNYYETVQYVGLIGLIFVLVAVLAARRRVVVLGLAVALLFSFAITYEPNSFHPVQNYLNNHFGELSTIRFERMRIITAFLFAVLGGIGVDALITRFTERRVRISYGVASFLALLGIGGLTAVSVHQHLKEPALTQRFDSLVWPIALAIFAIVIAIFIAMTKDFASSRAVRRLSGIVFSLLFLAQAGFLFFAGVGIPSYSNSFYGKTPAITKLQSIIGNNLLGLDGGNVADVREFHHIGFYPNVNLGYDVRLFAVHDPLIPAAYFSSWAVPQKQQGVGLFVPDINTVALAHKYGISYLIGPSGTKTPKGARLITKLKGEPLFYVPGSHQFSFDSGKSTVTSVADHGNGSWTINVNVKAPSSMTLRVTALPGWHLTANGEPIAIHTSLGVMEAANIPPGTTTLQLHYWPPRLGTGIHYAIVGLALVVLWTFGFFVTPIVLRRRKKSPMSAPDDVVIETSPSDEPGALEESTE